MISIPLNLKNEIENVIKMKFFEKIMLISNNFTNNLLYNFEISKFTKLELKIFFWIVRNNVCKIPKSVTSIIIIIIFTFNSTDLEPTELKNQPQV